ncbi:integrase core domain-containing protein [Haliangium ochraceum]|uniref:integrase core domain-containing protein n=1 Tax=Haliangium ochraceum TaxID=80816 RepID=UPI00019B9E68|nr:integrase core domain-containing protein [Haliangium ochraceum]
MNRSTPPRSARYSLRAGSSRSALPLRSPNLNAYAERFVRSVKSECLDQTVLLDEKHLRVTVLAHISRYHAERNLLVIGSWLAQLIENLRADQLEYLPRRAPQY